MSDHAHIEVFENWRVVARCGNSTAGWPCGPKALDPMTRNNPEYAIKLAKQWAYNLGAVTAEIHRSNSYSCERLFPNG